jgi:hypothetical protein
MEMLFGIFLTMFATALDFPVIIHGQFASN